MLTLTTKSGPSSELSEKPSVTLSSYIFKFTYQRYYVRKNSNGFQTLTIQLICLKTNLYLNGNVEFDHEYISRQL